MLVGMLVSAEHIIRMRMFVRGVDRVHMIMSMLGFCHDGRRRIAIAASDAG